MTRELKKIYFTLLSPAAVGLIVAGLGNEYLLSVTGEMELPQTVAPLVFILSVVFAIALPVMKRSLFAHKIRHQKSTSESVLFKFERGLICMISVAPYLALTVCLFELPLFYTAGTILVSLYGVYYYYPSEKRIQFERRIFRAR